MSKDVSKRYWLFQHETYYPAGGMNDFIGSFESIESATAALRPIDKDEIFDDYESWELLDSKTGKYFILNRETGDKWEDVE